MCIYHVWTRERPSKCNIPVLCSDLVELRVVPQLSELGTVWNSCDTWTDGPMDRSISIIWDLKLRIYMPHGRYKDGRGQESALSMFDSLLLLFEFEVVLWKLTILWIHSFGSNPLSLSSNSTKLFLPTETVWETKHVQRLYMFQFSMTSNIFKRSQRKESQCCYSNLRSVCCLLVSASEKGTKSKP